MLNFHPVSNFPISSSPAACFFCKISATIMILLCPNYLIPKQNWPQLTSYAPVLNCWVCVLNFSPEDIVTKWTVKYIDWILVKLLIWCSLKTPMTWFTNLMKLLFKQSILTPPLVCLVANAISINLMILVLNTWSANLQSFHPKIRYIFILCNNLFIQDRRLLYKLWVI